MFLYSCMALRLYGSCLYTWKFFNNLILVMIVVLSFVNVPDPSSRAQQA
jgi:hypothetical protein